MNIKRTAQNSLDLISSFGTQASFSSINDQITMGDNYSQIMIKGINALTMSLGVQFQNLTNDEAENAVSFLQSQFDYEAQNYSNEGKFTNKRIEPFDFQPPFPYKKQKVICTNFTHEKQAFNINSISATFLCIGSSILDSVEASLGHNPNISAQLNFVGPLSASNSSQSAVISSSDNFCSLNDNNVIYNAIDYRVAEVQSFANIQNGGAAAVNLKAPFGFPNGFTTSQHTNLRHSIYINEPNDCSFYPYASKYKGSTIPFRCFNFRPSNFVPIQNSPKYKDSNITDFYKKT